MSVHQFANENQETMIAMKYKLLQKYCKFLGMNKWESDDIVQETFLKALEKYDEKAITSALLKRMAHNQWIDTIRKNKKWELNNELDKEISIKKEIDNLMVLAEHLAIHLTIKQGIVYLLSEGFNYSIKEVAESLHLTEGAVKSILFRARNKIKQYAFHQNEMADEAKNDISALFYHVLKNEDPNLLWKAMKANRLCLQSSNLEKKQASVQSWHSEFTMAA
ncbi:sigma-70 family RNA polymerase sigma factor [Niallia sp. 03133]|uniref:sigma-70 family RNA polymerase sigma factor n=1 Tax=Niallia sp. 03133 TaxID=3458060 RepID=UPI004044982B